MYLSPGWPQVGVDSVSPGLQLYVAVPGLGGAACRNSVARSRCMLQFLGSEALYRRNSWVGGCISQLVGALQLYVALPGLGGSVSKKQVNL